MRSGRSSASKEKNCGRDDAKQGDCWDHVAYDPEHKFVVSVVPGKRTTENVEQVVIMAALPGCSIGIGHEGNFILF